MPAEVHLRIRRIVAHSAAGAGGAMPGHEMAGELGNAIAAQLSGAPPARVPGRSGEVAQAIASAVLGQPAVAAHVGKPRGG